MGLKDIKIGHRLALGFGLMIVLTLVMAFEGVKGMQSASANAATVAKRESVVGKVQEWEHHTRMNFTRLMAISKSGNSPEVKAYFDPDIKEATRRVNELQKDLDAAITDPKALDQLKQVQKNRAVYVSERDVYNKAFSDNSPGISAAFDRMMQAANGYYDAIGKLNKVEQDLNAEALQGLRSTMQLAQTMIAISTVLALLLGLGAAYLITHSVTQPVRQAVAAARHIADGDLSQSVHTDRRDEMGEMLRALSDMREALVRTISGIRESAHGIATTSGEIASGNHDLSARTEQTASNLQQTAANMTELTTAVHHSAEAAHQAHQKAGAAAQVAERGGAVAEQVVNTMNEISGSSKKIADIIGVIDGIAFQTNILALNAAVEAARAGEQGRGFAVVASEVRSLAGRSAEAAKEIKSLIGASVQKVGEGHELVQTAGSAMADMAQSVQSMTGTIAEITSAAQEQSAGIAQVNEAVNQLDQMTQQNAALVEQSSAAAESLRGQADRLTEAIALFKIDGGRAPGHGARALLA